MRAVCLFAKRWIGVGAIACVMMAVAPSAVHAQATVDLAWDANPGGENVARYYLYAGAQSGVYTEVFVINAPTTTYTYTFPGGSRYFAVLAENTSGVIGTRSNQLSVNGVNSPPTIATIANQTSVAGTAITPLQIPAADADADPLTFNAPVGLPAGLSMNATGLITGTPTTKTVPAVTVTVSVSAGGDGPVNRQFTWLVNTGSTLTSNVASPVAPGRQVTYTAGGVGCVGSCQFRFEQQTVGGATVTVQNWSSSTQFVWTALAPNNYNIIASVRSAGTTDPESTKQMAYTTSNAQDPVAPTVAIANPPASASLGSLEITVTGSATDSTKGNTGIISVTVNGVAASNGIAAGSGTANWTRTLTLPGYGANTLTVLATDGASNVGQHQITVTVPDPLPPLLTIASHSNGQTVTTANITVSGTATDLNVGGSTIASVTVNGVAASGGTAAASATANWSRTLAVNLGANVITVVVIDGAGNQSTQQITLSRILAFTDSVLTGVSIKALHFVELRDRINDVRAARGLSAYGFTDPALTPGTMVRAVHVQELREALSAAYAATGLATPAFTDPAPGPMTIRAVHIAELRSAVVVLE